MHILFYRPVGSKAWAIQGARDTIEEVFAAAESMVEGGPYEFRYAFLDPMKLCVADMDVESRLRTPRTRET